MGDDVASVRTCGDCVACCEYLRINDPDLKKPGLTPCPHLSDVRTEEGNCLLQKCKPAVCRSYSCLWLQGYGDDEDRPDRCGVLIDTVLPIANSIQAKPIRAGAGDTPEGNAAIERISRDTGKPALVARYPETQMVRVVGRGLE